MNTERAREQQPDNENLVQANRILYLTKDAELIRRQLEGEQLTDISPDQLIDNISTDVISPNHSILTWTGKEKGHLGKFLLTGLPGEVIKPGEIAEGEFDTVVAGKSFARGSSRIHAPLAFQDAGVKLIIAHGERIFAENCVNLNINLVDPDSSQAQQLLQGNPVPKEGLYRLLTPLAAEIMRNGNLLKYLKGIESGKIEVPKPSTLSRPMTIAEKIIAAKTLHTKGQVGVEAVKPGDEVVVQPNIYYGYELQTNATVKALREEFGEETQIRHPEKAFFYEDHTALMKDERMANLRREQAAFARPLGITVYEADPIKGAPAICHTDIVENHALPGQLVLGNDSHTCTVGSLNTLAVGKGSLDLAGALAYDKMTLTVPESIRINLEGRLPEGVSVKDLMLQFGATPELKMDRIGSGRVFEFGGEALDEIPFDEQIKLTNMSIELLGFTGIIERNKQIVKFLKERRGMSEEEIEALMVTSDEGAEYTQVFNINLSSVEQTVATPGDTQNGRPLSEIKELGIKPDKIYIGSCTHGTIEDLRQSAKVLRGRKIADGTQLFVQASSWENQEKAEEEGLLKDHTDAGAEVLPIGCGACISAGPGATEEGEIGLFATNRNFPGRTGKGETYLSSPAVAAASAIAGVICGPEDLKPLTTES